MKIRNATVFIVDDDASARKGLGRLIRTAGYDAKIYADALFFLKEVREMPNACIVLDMRMYNLAGSDVQKELISRGISMPVIVITADEDPDTRLKAKRTGAVAFFRKPVDGTALLDAITWAIGNCEQEDDR
jgi:two-component system response regulator FixJ